MMIMIIILFLSYYQVSIRYKQQVASNCYLFTVSLFVVFVSFRSTSLLLVVIDRLAAELVTLETIASSITPKLTFLNVRALGVVVLEGVFVVYQQSLMLYINNAMLFRFHYTIPFIHPEKISDFSANAGSYKYLGLFFN